MKIRLFMLWMAIVFFPLIIGCGGGVSGWAKVEVAELGLSMQLPSGWTVDRQNPRMFYESGKRDDNFGLVESYPLEGEPLNEYVERMSGVGGARLVSKTAAKIGGHQAIELVTEAAYTVIEVDIQKGDEVIRVSFRTLTEDYADYEPMLRDALQSLKIE
jgi:hypothetical protein